MHYLCFSTELSSTEWAAWIQAVGSVIAIGAAAGIAIWQSRSQYRNAIEIHNQEARDAKLKITRALFMLGKNCLAAVSMIIEELDTREKIHNVAEMGERLDLEELRRIDGAIRAIPLHELPEQLISPTMILNSTVRQFVGKVEMAVRLHSSMNSAHFEDLFRAFYEMRDALSETCDEINSVAVELSDIS